MNGSSTWIRRSGGLALAVLCLTLALEAQSPSSRPGFSIEIKEPANQSVVVGKTKIVAAVKISQPELVDRVEFLVGDGINSAASRHEVV